MFWLLGLIFAMLTAANVYNRRVVLVHDVLSCEFPGPSQQPIAVQPLFHEKAIYYLQGNSIQFNSIQFNSIQSNPTTVLMRWEIMFLLFSSTDYADDIADQIAKILVKRKEEIDQAKSSSRKNKKPEDIKTTIFLRYPKWFPLHSTLNLTAF